jgi:hypothetical protein
MLALLLSLACLAADPVPTTPPAPAASSPNPAILGQWESAVRTEGGLGNILEFRPDGRVTQISAAMAEADYKVEGEWLRVFWTDAKTGKTSEVDTTIEFEGSGRFVERGGDAGEEVWSERVGDPVPGASPLVGQWCSLYLDTLTTFREFTADRMCNRLPVVVLRGQYSTAGDTLTVQIDGQAAGRYPYRVEDGDLVIRSRDGSEKRYKRPECSLLKGY